MTSSNLAEAISSAVLSSPSVPLIFSTDAGSSSSAEFGYHGFRGGRPFAVVYSRSGLSVFLVTSHEVVETVTDPFPNDNLGDVGWYTFTGKEIADICQPEVVTVGRWFASSYYVNGRCT